MVVRPQRVAHRKTFGRGISLVATIVLAALSTLLPFYMPTAAASRKDDAVTVDHLGPAGGTVRFFTEVESAMHCFWRSTPKIPGFDESRDCGPGIAARSAYFKADFSPSAARWMVTLTEPRIGIVRRWRIVEVPPEITYGASVGANFTQDPANPFTVSYTYSADATTRLRGSAVDLGAIRALPTGVLDLYSDGSLECSMDVGGSVTTGSCTVTYSSLGRHSLAAEYQPSGLIAATPTDSTWATIGPYSSATSEQIVADNFQVSDDGTFTVYSGTYTVTAVTVDQNGYAVAPSKGTWIFDLRGFADDGNVFETTVSPPPGQWSCNIVVQATLADDYSSQSSSVSSPDCTGGIDTGSPPRPPTSQGNNVPGWLVTAAFTSSSSGFFDSSSGSQDVLCGE